MHKSPESYFTNTTMSRLDRWLEMLDEVIATDPEPTED